MVAITTYRNSLKSATKGYCFRSVSDQTLGAEQLIKEIIGYNSTITEADARAVLSVLNDRVKHFVNLGFRVELPFAFIQLKARGTVERLNDGFVPGTANHRFDIVCTFKEDAAREMKSCPAWRVAGVGWTVMPKITELVGVGATGAELQSLEFKNQDILRIKGRNLGFDAAKEDQGVFFVDAAGTEVRAGRYHSVGSAITDVYIPEGLPAGTYKVKVVTSPRKKSREEFTAGTPIVVGTGGAAPSAHADPESAQDPMGNL